MSLTSNILKNDVKLGETLPVEMVKEKEIQRSEGEIAAIQQMLLVDAYGRKQANIPDKREFWDSQPVPRLMEPIRNIENEPMDVVRTVDEIPAEPYALLAEFEWSDVAVENKAQLDELYDLLYNNYVEDDDAIFRFDYSRAFLTW